MFELYAYHGAQRVGLVEGVVSLQWMPEYCGAGEFKLVCAATPENVRMLLTGAKLWLKDTPQMVTVIEHLTQSETGNSRTLTARGRFGACMWEHRIVYGNWGIRGPAAAIYGMAVNNRRGLNVGFAAKPADPQALDLTLGWVDCLSAFRQIGEAGGVGFTHDFDPETAGQALRIYYGVDRRQGTAYRGYFSPLLGNLPDVQVTLSDKDYRTTAIVGGAERDGKQREICVVGPSGAAGDRELWVDCRGLSYTYQTTSPDGVTETKTYTDAEYRAELQKKGAEALMNHGRVVSVSATALDGVMEYGKDYELGDIVPVRCESFDLDFAARVTAIKLVYENGGRILRPVFRSV